MEGGWKTPPPSATTRQKSPVLIGLRRGGGIKYKKRNEGQHLSVISNISHSHRSSLY